MHYNDISVCNVEMVVAPDSRVGRFLLTTVSQDLSSQPVKLQTDGNLELTACPVQLPNTVDLSTSSLVTTLHTPHTPETCMIGINIRVERGPSLLLFTHDTFIPYRPVHGHCLL